MAENVSWWNGRSSRKEYWISIAIILAVALVIGYFNAGKLNTPLTIAWITVWRRRLHDFGWSGWVAAVPLLLIVGVLGAGFAIAEEQFGDALLANNRDESLPVTDYGESVYIGVILAALAIQIGVTVWWGVRAGEQGSNRFGPPPGAKPVDVATFN